MELIRYWVKHNQFNLKYNNITLMVGKTGCLIGCTRSSIGGRPLQNSDKAYDAAIELTIVASAPYTQTRPPFHRTSNPFAHNVKLILLMRIYITLTIS